MRGLWISLFLVLAQPVAAQDEPGFFDRLFGSDSADTDADQGSALERLIEDQLSGAGRQVNVVGFQGALSGAATLDSLTIADDDGIWLSITDAELDWSRAALLRGRIDVAKLAAAEIVLTRIPASDTTEAPTPEATGFQLPDLPVSINLGEISADRVLIGAPVFGVETNVSATGSLSLEGGEGAAKLDILRLDGRGSVTLDAGYANASGVLALELGLQEQPGGIFATLAGLPGAPSVNFEIAGTAPVSAYAADIQLATDGAERLTGRVATFTTDNSTGATIDISGDIAPVFAPEYRPFFGDDIALAATAFQTADGNRVLEGLTLNARAITLSGDALVDGDGTPVRFDVKGVIEDASGAPVLLPLSGDATEVDRVRLDVSFDKAQGEDWSGVFEIDGLARGDISVQNAQLTVDGQIATDGTPAVKADVAYRLAGLDLGDPSLDGAVGDDVSGQAGVAWESGGDLDLSGLTLVGKTYGLNGNAVLSTAGDDVTVRGEVKTQVDDFAVFSALAGRTLSGAAALDLTFDAAPLAGTFDVAAKGTTRDLKLDDSRADAILAGAATLDLRASRDAGGLDMTLNTVETLQANLSGRARLTSGGSTVDVSGALADGALLVDGLDGPISLAIAGQEDADRDWNVRADIKGTDIALATDGRLLDLYNAPRADGQVTASVGELGRFSNLAGRSLGGSLDGNLEGFVAFDLSAFAAKGTLTGADLTTGMADVDRLLIGDTTLDIDAKHADGRTDVALFSLESGAVKGTARGTLQDSASQLDLNARLNDIAPFVPGLNGPVTLGGNIADMGSDRLRLDLDGTGPGGIRATVSGTTAKDFSTLDVALTGAAPLELANRFIAPTTLLGQTSFDLRLAGPPDVASITGQVTARNVRLIAAEAGVALNNIAVDAGLGSGRVTLSITGNIDGGGRVSVTGPIGLDAPNTADLAITLTDARITDPQLYDTSLGGTVQITGPLTNGARISGNLALGTTEIRIPSSGLGGSAPIPQVVHLNEPPPVRGTRRRAGLIETTSTGRSGASTAFPLNITITAPNSLFVRGRGLDSEFGGALRLTGTTANIVPSGGFEVIRGRLDILGRRLELDEARITMEGSFEPRLRIVATTTVDDFSISVVVTGPASNPDIAFSSAPELPQEDVISRLIFGRGLENLSALQAARLAVAVRTLAGRGGEGVVGKIRSGAGLDDLDVTTTDDGNAAVRAGARLNDRLYTDVIVDSTGETELNLNLDVTPFLTLRGGVSSEGDSSVGIFYERDY